jgi:hypothetical protein
MRPEPGRIIHKIAFLTITNAPWLEAAEFKIQKEKLKKRGLA